MGEEGLCTKPRSRGRPPKPLQEEQKHEVVRSRRSRGRPKTELWGREHLLSKKFRNGQTHHNDDDEEEEEEEDGDEGYNGDVVLKDLKAKVTGKRTEKSPRKSTGSGVKKEEDTHLSFTPPEGQKDRWSMRGMWELASVLNFLSVFREALKISIEFSAEELETALITPNNTLSQLHIQLLKGVPPVSKGLSNDTWVQALCKKLGEWWSWVAEGEVPLVSDRGEETTAYQDLDPCTRVLILKALCEIRVEQDDIWRFIDDSMKNNQQLSTFRKERLGGDSHGVNYWYDADYITGHRLYREILKIETKPKPKGKGRMAEPVINCQWETIATNLEEFESVSEKLVSSRNRMEAGIGKKIQNEIIPILEEHQKKKERALKKQQRQAMLLDSFFLSQADAVGRPRRERKPVKYTFDDYDRSIEEAIQLTKKGRAAADSSHKSNGHLEGHGSGTDKAFPSVKNENGEPRTNATGRITRSSRVKDVNEIQSARIPEVPENDSFERDIPEDEKIPEDRKMQEDGKMQEEGNTEEDGNNDAESLSDKVDSESDDGYKEDDGDEEYKGEEDEVDDEDDVMDYNASDSTFEKKPTARRKRSRRVDDDNASDSTFEKRPISRRKVSRRFDDDEEEDDASISYDDGSEDDRRYPIRGKKQRKVMKEPSSLRRSNRATRVDYSKYENSNSDEENEENSTHFKSVPKRNKTSGESGSGSSDGYLMDSNDIENDDDTKSKQLDKDEEHDTVQSHEAHPDIKSWNQLAEQTVDLNGEEDTEHVKMNSQEPSIGKRSWLQFGEKPLDMKSSQDSKHVDVHPHVHTEQIRSWEQLGEQSLDLKNQHFIDLNEAAPLTPFDDEF